MDEIDKTITLEAKSEQGFPFVFYIEKAVPTENEDELLIEGVASTTNIDHDNERMSQDALMAMEAAINDTGVPLRVEHQKDELAVIGKVFKAWVDERNQLHIRARLDKSHPVSSILHNSMKSGVKMGLSVGGIVKRAVKEFAESVGGMVKTFYDVALQEVSVTPRPANYDSWLIAKSIAKDEKEAESYSENVSLRREFFFENSQLDYLRAFAKSVPDKAWRKVDSLNINKEEKNMAEKEETKPEETETEKAVSRSEFNSLKKDIGTLVKAIVTGFNKVGVIVKATDGAEDENDPDKKKPSDVDKAEDEETDDTKKSEETEDETKKADEETEDETKKSEDETEEEKKSSKKSAKKTSKEDDDYDLEHVTRAIKTLDGLRKKMKKDEETETEAEKAEDTEEDDTKKAEDDEDTDTEKAEDTEETEATKTAHPLDLFVARVTKTMEDVVARLEKSGKRVPGFESEFISKQIVNNPEVQQYIQKMMKVPGQKKSVAMGNIPFMITKDGKRIALTTPSEQVEKSEQPKDFRSLYKQRYSGLSNDSEE